MNKEEFYVKTEDADYRKKVIAELETMGYKFDTESTRVSAFSAIYICANAHGLIGCGHESFPKDYEERHLWCGQFVPADYFSQPATEKTYEPLPLQPFKQWALDRMKLLAEHISHQLSKGQSVPREHINELQDLNELLKNAEF